jgi:hypothetical protein
MGALAVNTRRKKPYNPMKILAARVAHSGPKYIKLVRNRKLTWQK